MGVTPAPYCSGSSVPPQGRERWLGDPATTNFAFGGPNNQYVYFEGRRAGHSGASRRPIQG